MLLFMVPFVALKLWCLLFSSYTVFGLYMNVNAFCLTVLLLIITMDGLIDANENSHLNIVFAAR